MTMIRKIGVNPPSFGLLGTVLLFAVRFEACAFVIRPRAGRRIGRHVLRAALSDGTETQASPTKLPRISKFAGLMAGDDSTPESTCWPEVRFQLDEDSKPLTATLPDDDCSVNPEPPLHNRRTLHYLPSLLSPEEVSSIMSELQSSASTGAALQERNSRCIVAVEDGETQPNDLSTILLPILRAKVLPFSRTVCNAPDMVVADALVRSYDSAEGKEALAPHYDVSSFCSVIIPLNPQDCEGGLYVQSGAGLETRRSIQFDEAGDALLHRYDVMHGVHVRKGKRYSLVVWLAETEDAMRNKVAPWVGREAGESVHAAFLNANNAKDGLYGATQDTLTARRFYEWAAERGHALSQYCLAIMLLKESGATGANGRVAKLLEMASDRGLAMAQHELGTAFKEGYFGVGRDEAVARTYYRLAAKQGYGRSVQVLEDATRWKGQELTSLQ